MPVRRTHTTFLFALTSALCFGGPLLAQHTLESETNPLAGNRAAIMAGNRLYDGACQSCHGAGARGDRAPALATGIFRHGNADGQLFLNIRNGINGTAMPAFSQFTSDQVWQLVSYIRSLAGMAAVNERVSGSPAAGKAIFEGKGQCLSCHTVNGQGQPVGPDLSAAGNGSSQALEAVILNPNQPPAAPGGGRGPRRGGLPVTLTVKTADGHEYRGVRRSEDVFSLQMVDTAGQLHLFDKAGLTEVRVENKSLMPDDYARRLNAPEIQNLVAYLKTLTGRDLAQPVAVNIPGGLTSERIVNARAEPQNWLSYWGDPQGWHYSTLSQIDTSNVRQLQARWAVPIPGNGIVESVPLVVDGVMYTTGPPGQVFALDARTGRQIWRYQRTQKVVNPYESNRVNRGVAVLGNRLFFGTLDAAVDTVAFVRIDHLLGALVAPDLPAGAGIQCEDLSRRPGGIHHAIHHQRDGNWRTLEVSIWLRVE